MSPLIDVERDGTVVVREIAATRAGSLMAAIMAAARQLHAVIEHLELRPNHDMLDARILVAPDQQGERRSEPLELVDALLARLHVEEPVPA